MKILNVGTMEPVIVILGNVSQLEIRQLGGVLLGTMDSKVDTTKKSTWISFENFYKLTQAREMIERGELK